MIGEFASQTGVVEAAGFYHGTQGISTDKVPIELAAQVAQQKDTSSTMRRR